MKSWAANIEQTGSENQVLLAGDEFPTQRSNIPRAEMIRISNDDGVCANFSHYFDRVSEATKYGEIAFGEEYLLRLRTGRKRPIQKAPQDLKACF